MHYYRRLSSPRIVGVAMVNTPTHPIHCQYCGQPISFKFTPKVAQMEIDMGLGNFNMKLLIHRGCVNVIDEDGRDANKLIPM